eukprot:4272748-Prymnesium_polylepis.1
MQTEIWLYVVPTPARPSRALRARRRPRNSPCRTWPVSRWRLRWPVWALGASRWRLRSRLGRPTSSMWTKLTTEPTLRAAGVLQSSALRFYTRLHLRSYSLAPVRHRRDPEDESTLAADVAMNTTGPD